MNTVEAAALRALKPYYLAHWDARRNDPAGLTGPCECAACRQARIAFDLLGVNPLLLALDASEVGEPRLSA